MINIKKNEFLFDHELLCFIELDIREKYNKKHPKFMIEGVFIDDTRAIEDWVDFQLCNDLWVKYKYINDDIFELKECFPHPPDSVCDKLIDDFFDYMNKNHKNVYYEIAGVIYDEIEVRQEIMYSLREGYQKVECYKMALDEKQRNLCQIIFSQESETHWSLYKGYLILEEK